MVIDPNGKIHHDSMWVDAYEHAGEIDGWYEAPSTSGRSAFIQKGKVLAVIDSDRTGGYDYRGKNYSLDPTLTKEKFERMLKLEAFQ